MAVVVAVKSELSVAVAVGLETGGDGGGAVCGDGGGGSRSLRPGFCDSAGVGDGADTAWSRQELGLPASAYITIRPWNPGALRQRLTMMMMIILYTRGNPGGRHGNGGRSIKTANDGDAYLPYFLYLQIRRFMA